MGHIIVNYPNKKNDKNKDKKNDEKKKKKFIKKKKNGQAYFVEWDSDASSDDDDDDKPSKGVAGIAIKEAPSLFSTPHCLMAKGGAKVLQDDDELEEFSYDDLVDMLNDAGNLVIKEKEKLKDLELKYGSLQASYEELKTSHENLKETHEKLKEAHNTLLDHKDKAKLSMGASSETCKSCHTSSSTNPSCSTSEKSSCDESLILENEKLKKEVICLTNDLSKCYDSRAKFNHC